MSGSGEALDVYGLRYRNYPGGLVELVERVLITGFISSFEEMNKNVTLTRAQLKECWFYALHREHAKIMSSTTHMTPTELAGVAELFAWGIQQADSLHWLSRADKAAANRQDAREMQADHLHQLSMEQNGDLLSKNPEYYDPLLLLQSIQEVREYAELLYEKRLPRLLGKTGGNQSYRMLECKRDCVNLAQKYVTGRLKVKFLAWENSAASQSDGSEAMVLESQLVPQNPVVRWEPVLAQIKAEKDMIISELGTAFLNGQDTSKNLDISNSNQSTLWNHPEAKRDSKPEPLGLTSKQRRLWREAKLQDKREALETSDTPNQDAMEFDRIHPMTLSNQRTQQTEQDMVMQIAEGMKSLLRDEDTPKSQSKRQQPGAGQKSLDVKHLMHLLAKTKAKFEAGAEGPQEHGMALRQVKRLERRLKLSRRGHKRARRLQSHENSIPEPTKAGSGHNKTRRNRPPSRKSRSSKRKAHSRTSLAGPSTQTDVQPDKGDEMDIEMSERMARLEVETSEHLF